MRVSFHFFDADFSEQQSFVLLLDAELTDMVRTAVYGAVDARVLLFVDATDVADGVYAKTAGGVVALQTRVQLDTVQMWAVDGKTRGFLTAQMRTQCQAFKTRALAKLFLKLPNIARMQLDDVADLA